MTAGGLLFIGATNHDRKFHAFDKSHGKAAVGDAAAGRGQRDAVRLTRSEGRQYVVIAAGGGKSGAASGGSYVAFALK